MKTFRLALFWMHLVVGVVAGVIILIMSVTGVALTYEKQMLEWADRRAWSVPSSARTPRLSPETLLAKVREAQPTAAPATLTLRADPAAPATVSLAGNRTLLVHPTTGAIIGPPPTGMRSFFRSMTSWHRWLALDGAGRSVARAITGAANLGFLFVVLSGIYLWFPRVLTRSQFRQVLWFRGGLSSKARDFNWHNVIGFWSAIPLAVVVAGAVPISYPWASNLVYRLVGEEPPRPQGPPGGASQARGGGPGGPGGPARQGDAAGAAARPEGTPAREGGAPRVEGAPAREGGPTRGRGGPAGGRGRPEGRLMPATPQQVAGLDAQFATAAARVSGWRTISIRVPQAAPAPFVFTIDEGYGGQPQLRGTLTLNRETGTDEKFETFASLTPGRRLRSWLRFAHTGEIYGLTGQTIAGIVSAGGVVLVYTGLALAWRRCFAWIRRRRAAAQPALNRAA